MQDRYLNIKPRQGWSCTIQGEGEDDPRLEDDDSINWCDVQLPGGMLPDQLQGEALIYVTKAVCGRVYKSIQAGCKVIWEKLEDTPEYYSLAFDENGKDIHPDIRL